MYNVNIKIKKLNENAIIPKQMSLEAACMDLTATEIIQEDEDKVQVKFGFATAIPVGYKICFSPRSSFTNKGWILANTPSQIDSDYRGEWMARFDAIPSDISSGYIEFIGKGSPELKYPKFPYKVGDRVLQCWLEEVIDTIWEEVEDLDETERSAGGFGSTGQNIHNNRNIGTITNIESNNSDIKM